MELDKHNPTNTFERGEPKRDPQASWERLLAALGERELPDEVVQAINERIASINAFEGSQRAFERHIRKQRTGTLQLLEKKVGLVQPNHYMGLWMALGLGIFGTPLGIAMGASLGNYGLIGLGLPIGLMVGMLIGMSKDKQAQKEGKQLPV